MWRVQSHIQACQAALSSVKNQVRRETHNMSSDSTQVPASDKRDTRCHGYMVRVAFYIIVLVNAVVDIMQVEDAFYFLPNPFPEGIMVGVVKQTLGLVDSSSRQVPLSEVPICEHGCCLPWC